MAKLKKRLWIQNHVKDLHVKKSINDGYRSRASYKLLQIDEKDKLFKVGMTVVDLGAAPGGWAQVASKLVGKSGMVVAIDLLPIEAIAGVKFLQGDVEDGTMSARLQDMVGFKKTDVIMSDMAPNLSGISDIDGPKIIHLANLALELSEKILKNGGSLVVKLFHSEEVNGFVRKLRRVFNTLKIRKPKASRSGSSEVYVVAKGYRG